MSDIYTIEAENENQAILYAKDMLGCDYLIDEIHVKEITDRRDDE